MKNPPCQSARRVSRKLYQLFSSFLRGASCPKSPRLAATAAKSFMPKQLWEVKGRFVRDLSPGSQVGLGTADTWLNLVASAGYPGRRL